MIDDIKELERMHIVLMNKLIYFKSINDEIMVKGIEKNLKKVSERIKELKEK